MFIRVLPSTTQTAGDKVRHHIHYKLTCKIELKLKTFRLGRISEGPSEDFLSSSGLALRSDLTALGSLYHMLDALEHRHFREEPSHPDFQREHESFPNSSYGHFLVFI